MKSLTVRLIADSQNVLEKNSAELVAGKTPVPQPCFVSIFTFVIALGCLTIGGLGLTIRHAEMPAPPPSLEPVQAEVLNVDLTQKPAINSLSTLSPETLEPPVDLTGGSSLPTRSRTSTAAPQPMNLPPEAPKVFQPTLPAPAALAVASPEIVFASPVENVVSSIAVERSQVTTDTRSSQTGQPVAPQVLTFGQGEGKQPAPEYPGQAVRAGLEGIIKVNFVVGENGRVAAAQAVEPCPWNLLNDSALRTVRQQWRFAPGKRRAYEVAIRFQLAK